MSAMSPVILTARLLLMLFRLAFQLLCYTGAVIVGAFLCQFTGAWIFLALFGALFLTAWKGVI
jgi:hypothetical protein